MDCSIKIPLRLLTNSMNLLVILSHSLVVKNHLVHKPEAFNRFEHGFHPKDSRVFPRLQEVTHLEAGIF